MLVKRSMATFQTFTMALLPLIISASAPPINESEKNILKHIVKPQEYNLTERERRFNEKMKRTLEEEEYGWGDLWYSYYYPHSRCHVELDSVVKCFITDSNMSCQEYIESISRVAEPDCIVNVTYKYDVVNVGEETESINSFETSVANAIPFDNIIESIELPPRETFRIEEERILDICSFATQDLTFDVKVACMEGEPRSFERKIEFRVEGSDCNCEFDISCESSSGDESCRPAEILDAAECQFHPFYLDFNFTGSTCKKSSNNQSPSEVSCVDYGDITSISSAFLVVQASKEGIEYFSGVVNKNKVFTAGIGYRVDSNMDIIVYNHQGGALLQKVRFLND